MGSSQSITVNNDNVIESPQLQLQELASKSLAVVQTSHDEFLKDFETMRTTIDDFKQELAYFIQDEDAVKNFIEMLRLFKSKALKKLEHEMQLADDVKVNLQITVATHAYKVDNQQIDTARDKTIEVYKQNIEEIKAENAKLISDNAKLHQDIMALKRNFNEKCKINDVDVAESATGKVMEAATINEHHLLPLDAQLKEEERQQFQAFSEALSLFKRNVCKECKFKLKLSGNTTVHIQMVAAVQDADGTKSYDEKQQYQQKLKELEAVVRELRRPLEVAVSTRQANN